MTTTELCNWIKEVIEVNNLKELIFIWDEFSEYFENNIHHLTGFQEITELAATVPFCLMIVTHKAEGYFSDGDPDKRKILDRFVTPIHISLPENIAFELMAQAMKITDDKDLAEKWEKNKNSLDKRTMQSRTAVKNSINLTDKDLSNVLPIHPYAALILQHISIYYTSTARSMFNFIKNDEGEDVHAFQWFIKNYDFNEPNPFVTVDMLWSFFYEKGKERLANGIREILDCYTKKIQDSLVEDEKRVFKTILLLQAISDRMVGNRDIFLPNDRNLSLAFEGTDLEFAASKIAEGLLSKHIVTRTPLTGEKFSYCCKNTSNQVDAEPYKDEAKVKSTKDLIAMPNSNLNNVIPLSGALKLRYKLTYSSISDFDSEIRRANNPSIVSNSIYAVATIGRDSTESAAIKKKISNFYESDRDTDVVIIDLSDTTLSEEEYSEFVENYAMALAVSKIDINERKTYEKYAVEVLQKWAKNIQNGSFNVYSKYVPKGERIPNVEELFLKLADIVKSKYPKCLEIAFPNVINTMYDSNVLNNGAECGIIQKTSGTFKCSNESGKLETALAGAWGIDNYWKKSTLYISNLKNDIDDFINQYFQKSDRISIATIFDHFQKEPYGFIPCNLTSFILGFLLKEYANENYSYSDNMTTVPLDCKNLSQMIVEILKNVNTPDKRL